MTSFPKTPQFDEQRKSSPAGPSRESTFFPASALAGKPIPARNWVAQDLIPSKTVTLLGGDGGTGKSLLALQLAIAVSSGRQWLNRQVAHGSAIFISAEDDEEELHRRVADVVDESSLTLADLDRLTLRSLAGENALLAELERSSGALTATSLFRELERRLGDDPPALLVLDTLADLFPGNENDRAQARHFIGMLRGLAIRHDCAVVLLAHPSLSGLNSRTGTSGSTAWNNSVRSRLYLERVVADGYEANPDARVLTTKKSNHARVGDEIAMTWRAGVFVADRAPNMLDRMAATAKAERVFLKLLRALEAQGRKVNHAGGTTYAPKVFSEHPESEGVSKAALRTAMETLLAKERIVITESGPPSKRRTHLEVAA